jgi:hypothetical protein
MCVNRVGVALCVVLIEAATVAADGTANGIRTPATERDGLRHGIGV